jgi:dTDP-4-dehydrorhamnose 3,5-epimerase
MIDGVKIKRLPRIIDERGWLAVILRDDDEDFIKFGQVYLTTCNPGVVKAWHAHRKQCDNFCVLRGTAKVGLYDDREGSPTFGQTQAVIMCDLEPALLQIPPMVWHGFTPVSNETVYLLNIPTEHYDAENPDEMRRDPFDPEIPFDWTARSG